jgi:hypothetical protein
MKSLPGNRRALFFQDFGSSLSKRPEKTKHGRAERDKAFYFKSPPWKSAEGNLLLFRAMFENSSNTTG